MLTRNELRKKARELLKELHLTGGFNCSEFVEKLRRRKDYKIKLEPISMPPGYFGFWSLVGDCHVILYRANTSWLHQQQIVFHECGHILLNHHPGDLKKFLQRKAVYSEPEEREAEIFATVLLEAAIVRDTAQESISVNKNLAPTQTPTEERLEEVISMQNFLLELKEKMPQPGLDIMR